MPAFQDSNQSMRKNTENLKIKIIHKLYLRFVLEIFPEALFFAKMFFTVGHQ